jgi:hypothetical protein
MRAEAELSREAYLFLERLDFADRESFARRLTEVCSAPIRNSIRVEGPDAFLARAFEFGRGRTKIAVFRLVRRGETTRVRVIECRYLRGKPAAR